MEDDRNLLVKREIRKLVKMSLQILCGFLKNLVDSQFECGYATLFSCKLCV